MVGLLVDHALEQHLGNIRNNIIREQPEHDELNHLVLGREPLVNAPSHALLFHVIASRHSLYNSLGVGWNVDF